MLNQSQTSPKTNASHVDGIDLANGDRIEMRPNDPTPRMVVMPPQNRQTVWWMMTVLLAVIATSLVMRWDTSPLARIAFAQASEGGAGPGLGARGIYAFTGQLSSKSYGLFMMDVDSGTLWCYEIAKGAQGEPHMKLVAARSWISDRYLEEFNVATPTPSEVRQLVEQQRTARRQRSIQQPGSQAPPAEPADNGQLRVPETP